MEELSAPQSGTGREPTVPARESTGALTATSWRPRDVMSFEDWVEAGRKLGLMGRSAGWWLGDWLHYGTAAYGERYTRAARITGYDVQTLMNMVYVASRIEPCRRQVKLSWSHHVEVVPLTRAEQDRWLERAERERMSVRCLREAIRTETRARKNADQRAAAPLSQSSATSPSEDERHMTCPACGHSFDDDDDEGDKEGEAVLEGAATPRAHEPAARS